MLPQVTTTVVSAPENEESSEKLQELQSEVNELQEQQAELQTLIREEPNPEVMSRLQSVESNLQRLQEMIRSLTEMVEEATTVTELEMEEQLPAATEVTIAEVTAPADIPSPVTEAPTAANASDANSSVMARLAKKVLFG